MWLLSCGREASVQVKLKEWYLWCIISNNFQVGSVPWFPSQMGVTCALNVPLLCPCNFSPWLRHWTCRPLSQYTALHVYQPYSHRNVSHTYTTQTVWFYHLYVANLSTTTVCRYLPIHCAVHISSQGCRKNFWSVHISSSSKKKQLLHAMVQWAWMMIFFFQCHVWM